MTQDQLIALDITAVIALSTFILGLLKPMLEKIPAFANTPANIAAHDNFLRACGIVLNFGLLIGLLASQHVLDWSQWYAYLGAAMGLQIPSHVAFKVVKGVSGVSATDSGGADPSSASPAALPAGALDALNAAEAQAKQVLASVA